MSRGAKIKEIEEFPRRLKIFFWIIFLLLLFGTLGFILLDNQGIKSSFLRTLQTLAFIFEDSPSISERLLEIFLALVGVFLIWWVLWSIADMLLDGNLKKYLKSKWYASIMSGLKEHVIIAGGGRVGEEVAKALTLKNKKFIIIESNSEVAHSLMKKNYLVIEGNTESEELLLQAGIKNAKKIIITLPKTETNILITLTAKELNPSIEVYSRCDDNKLVSKLKKAGAKLVVVPEVVAGDKLADSIGI